MWGDEWLKVPPRYLIRGEGQGKYLLNGNEWRASLEGGNHKKQKNFPISFGKIKVFCSVLPTFLARY